MTGDFKRLTTLVAALAIVALPPSAEAKDATATGGGGAVSTVDEDATQAGIKVLRTGGNAVDAAVAAASVLGVTEPYSSGIGGGGYMVIRTPGGRVTTIDGRETAPAAATQSLFINPDNGQPYAFADAVNSGLSVGTPGTVATWDRALDRFGTTTLADALKPGIKVAKKGFEVDQTFFDQTQQNAARFREIPSTADLYLPNGAPAPVGSTLKNPDMAKAYARIAKKGREGFYTGPIAKDVVDTVQDPPIDPTATGTWRPGLLTLDDLAGYRERPRSASRVNYRGLNVYGMKPSSSGGITVGEALNILEGYQPLGSTRVEALHRFIEASHLAFADRGAYIGDRAFVDVPVKKLLSNSFAAERRALIGANAFALPTAPGDPADNGGDPRAASGDDTEGLSTTHMTVADSDGRIVSYTFTIEQTGGDGIVVPGWGFLLNNELTDFSFAPTQGNRPDPNLPAGGKRPRSSMSPTIVTKANGKPLLAVGSPGGSTIITTVLQILVERLDLGKTLPEAIATPRLSPRNTAQIQAEPAFLASPESAGLQALGHNLTTASPPEIGAATGIEFLKGGRFLAAAEPARRGGGSAAVVDPD